MLSMGGQKLRDLERAAKQSKVAMWTNYVPQVSNQGKLSDTYTGKVRERGRDDPAVGKGRGALVSGQVFNLGKLSDTYTRKVRQRGRGRWHRVGVGIRVV